MNYFEFGGFLQQSWLLSLNLGWEGGVHVQTCGHHLHLNCLKLYLESLCTQARPQSIAVARGEYLCPLCRQLANSVLPLSPQLGKRTSIVRSRHSSQTQILMDLNLFLKEIQRPSVSISNEDLKNTFLNYPFETLCLFLLFFFSTPLI